MTNKQLFALAAALSAASLTGCSGSADEPAPVENAATTAESLPQEEPAPVSSPTPVATEAATVNASAEVPPEEAPAPDEQMMDDAAATGMTARSTRDEGATQDTTPTEPAERK
ncbi:MAG TPA: hypothetical protein VF695_05250 [Sphingomonas sp.]|jgi:hypothetical protein